MNQEELEHGGEVCDLVSDEWAREIERRVAELDAGAARTAPWTQIRAEALARIGYA